MGSTFEMLAVPTSAADVAERWLDGEIEVNHLDPDGWVVLQTWEWDDVRGLSHPSIGELEVEALLWAACFDSDYAMIYFEALDTGAGWLFVNPEVAREFGEGLQALSKARALQGSDVEKEGLHRFLAWAGRAPRLIAREEAQAALDDDTLSADEKLALLLVNLGLGATEEGFANALPVTDRSDQGWPRVEFRLRLQRRLDSREQSLLDQVFTEWYQFWVAVPYESVRDITDIEFTDTRDGCTATWSIDFGVADRRSLDSLVSQLRSAAARGVPAIKLIIATASYQLSAAEDARSEASTRIRRTRAARRKGRRPHGVGRPRAQTTQQVGGVTSGHGEVRPCCCHHGHDRRR